MKLDNERPSSILRSPVRKSFGRHPNENLAGYAPYGKPAPARSVIESVTSRRVGVLLSGPGPGRESGLNKHLCHEPERVCIDGAFGVETPAALSWVCAASDGINDFGVKLRYQPAPHF